MNANWIAGGDGDDGDFELMIVTSDDRRHVVVPSPATKPRSSQLPRPTRFSSGTWRTDG
jgi:hypothetical protein